LKPGRGGKRPGIKDGRTEEEDNERDAITEDADIENIEPNAARAGKLIDELL
jgi:hypothetical protein